MLLTVVLSLVMMASLFVMLYAAVALVQDKRLFTSAPKNIQAAVQPKAECFPGAHVLGWCLLVFAVFLFIGTIVCGGWDGVRNDFSFRQFFFRFLFMLVSLKAFDVLVFDWFLLCHSQLLYVKKVLSGMSSKTIWRAFYSTNNYSMPESVSRPPCPVQYWYGEAERSARKWDIAYMKQVFPDTVFVELAGQDHAEFFTLHPEAFCEQLEAFISTS